MNDNVAKISIIADATGVRSGTEKAKNEVGELAPVLAKLNAGFAELAALMRQSMSQGAASAEKLSNEMRQLVAHTDRESRALAEMNARIGQAAAATDNWHGRISGAIAGVAAVLSVQQVVDFSQRMGEAAEKTALLSQRLGMTTGDVQMLGALAEASQSNVDTFAGAIAKLDRTFASAKEGGSAQAAAFKQIGIDVQGSYSQIELLKATMAAFGTMADGPAKVALAMTLFGRSGAELIPILSMTAEQQREFTAQLARYGVVNDDAVAKGNLLADAWDANGLAMRGLEQTLTSALAPSLTAIVQGTNALIERMVASYNAGGAVKQVFDALTAAGETVIAIVTSMAPVLETLANNFGAVVAAVEILAIAMSLNMARSALSAVASMGIVRTAIFAVRAEALGAATAMQALALVGVTTGRALLAAFGGPVGIVIAALAVGIYALTEGSDDLNRATGAYAKTQEEARQVTEKAATVADKLAMAHGKARVEALALAKAEQENIKQKLASAEASVVLAQAELARARSFQAAQNRASIGGGVPGTATFIQGTGDTKVAQARANEKAAQDAVAALEASLKKIQTAIDGAATPQVSFGGTGAIPGGSSKGSDGANDTRLSKWEQELERAKSAIAALADAEGTFREMSKSSEAEYWGALLERTDLSQQERLQIEKRYYGLRRDVRRDEYDQVIAGFSRQLDEARDSAAERERIVLATAAYIKSKFGEESREYQRAQEDVVRAAREAAEERKRIEAELIQAKEAMRLAEIDEEREIARWRVEMGISTQAELLQIERAAEQQSHAVRVRALRDQAALATKSNDLERAREYYRQIEELTRTHQSKLNQIERAATLQRTIIQRNAINSTAQLWGQNISRLLTLQQSFGETIRNLYVGMVGIVADALASIIAQWLAKKLAALIIGGAAEKASGVATITSEAAKAGAGGTASMAAAPFPLNLGAPAFGAAMAGIAMGYQAMLAVPGFAVGAKNLSKDQLAVVHSGEMVIPAAEAGGWRRVMELFAGMPRLNLPAMLQAPLAAGFATANSNAPPADNDRSSGGQHFYGPVIMGDLRAIDTQSGAKFLMQNHSHVAAAANKAMRNGFGPKGAS
ncbi:hypothetical protein [Sphingomonas sp.]|uniref:hypothetical protein n=1 Tax=Sphingomonas sp. TaxID=28214 RepID=UPI003BA8DFC0